MKDDMTENLEYCAYTDKLLEKIELFNNHAAVTVDLNIINEAILYAKYCHAGQFRKSGEAFVTHPLEVAFMLCDYCFTTEAIVTAILHDTIEDTAATKESITRFFGEIIAQNVVDLTRISENGAKISSAELVNILFKQKKYDLLLIKQFDRVHNMRTLHAKSMDKIRTTVRETIATFTVLAAHLNLKNIESEIAKLCLQFVDLESNCETEKRDAYLLSLIFEPQNKLINYSSNPTH